MFNSPFANVYTPQANIDRINNQINELERMRSQYQQQSNQPQAIITNATFSISRI